MLDSTETHFKQTYYSIYIEYEARLHTDLFHRGSITISQWYDINERAHAEPTNYEYTPY